MMSNEDRGYKNRSPEDTPVCEERVGVHSQEVGFKPPFPNDPVKPEDLDPVRIEHIETAIESGILPAFGAEYAISQKRYLQRLVQLYITYRKFAFCKTESRQRAEISVADEYEISIEHCKALYSRLHTSNSSKPTDWMEERLEAFWRWWVEKYGKLPEGTGLRDSVRRLRQALLELRDVKTPAVSINEFTPRDFIDAGDEYILNSLEGSNARLRSEPLVDEPAEARPNFTPKPRDMTQYDVPWAENWCKVLDLINEHLEWYSKDDAVGLTDGLDCSEAYAQWKSSSSTYYDVRLEVKYHASGCMHIRASVWPPWKEETETIGFNAIGTSYSEASVDTFTVTALRDAERSAPGPDKK